MNTKDFTYLLEHPNEVNATQISDIRTIVDQFPYFQSARALYLKGLKNSESFKYNQELKTTAAYTTDRSVLFDFITSEEFLQNKISEQIKSNIANLRDIELVDVDDISVRHSVVIDDALREQIKESKPILDPSLFIEKPQESHFESNDEKPLFEVDSAKIEQTPEQKLNIGTPLEFEKTEMHSFSEWLNITNQKPIIRFENTVEEISKDTTEAIVDLSDNDIIDKFIETNPKISPIKQEGSTKNLAKARMLQPDTLMTETLARIYVEQKNYKKAIQAYKVLSLKYPEKSSFFADRIQAVKELQK